MADPSVNDDASSAYMAHAQDQSTQATIDAFERRMRGQQAVEQRESPKKAPSEAPLRITVRPMSVMQKLATGAGAVASDVSVGFTESPSAIAGGMIDATRNTVGALDSLGNWLNEKVLDTRIPIPLTGNELLDKIIANPLSAFGESTEKLPAQKSTTGHVLREGARFLTGFVPTLRALRGAGATGTVAAPLLAGAVSDFMTQDPNEKNLSALLQSVPALKNPVNEFLATDPDDNEAQNRLRHAIEGMGFGVLTEGLVRGIRAMAHGKKAKTEIETRQQEVAARDEEAFGFLGDTTKAPVVVANEAPEKLTKAIRETETGVPPQVAARGVAEGSKSGKPPAKTAAPEVYVNFARIETPDDVQTVIRDMANAFKGEIDTARRGVQSNAETAKLADNLGMTVEDLLARRKGQPLNAGESLAARRLLNTSAEKLLDAAQRASAPNAGPVDLHNFRRMMAIHHAIQSEVFAARTETARALQAWAIPAGTGNAEKAKMIERLMVEEGAGEVSVELAKRIATLNAQGISSGAMAEVVRRGWAASTLDAVKEAYVLGLLWNPTTHFVNAGSNLIVGFQQIYERAVAKQVGDFLGSSVDSRVVDGEALAMTYGMITSLKDAFSLAGRALRTGETGAGMGKIEIPRERAISSATVAREMEYGAADAQAFAEAPMGRAIDFIGAVNGVPGRVLGAGDEFFRTIAYRAEVHAQALRQATQEGASGPELYRRMAEIANSPPEHIRMAAADAALYATFQNKPGSWAQSLLGMRNSGTLNPTFLILPFIKTPANILRYSFERTPLAPLVGQWRDDIAAGGARRDLAIARLATGTAVMAVALDLASSGLVTGQGPSDPGKRETLMRQGWQPNSVYIDGKYYSFNRADPFGMVFGFAGAIAERMKDSDSSPEDFDAWEEILASAIGAVSASVVDKTYFQGVTNVLNMISGAQRGEGGVERWIDRQTGSLLPLSSAFGSVKRFVDPVTREVNSPWDAIQAKIAGLSEGLPPARDLWGRERKPGEVYGRVYDALSPIAVRQRQDSHIDAEMERLGASVRRIQKRGVFAGVEVNFRNFPDVYDEYVRLAGNDLKHPAWGLGAKDYLDAVVSGRHPLSAVYNIYSSGPEGGKAAFIKSAVSEYRKLAQEHIMAQRDRWPEFAAHIEGGQVKRQELKMPEGMKVPPVSGPRLPAVPAR